MGPLGADLRVAPCVDRHWYSGFDAFVPKYAFLPSFPPLRIYVCHFPSCSPVVVVVAHVFEQRLTRLAIDKIEIRTFIYLISYILSILSYLILSIYLA